ncbi:MAG TPA: sulfotransferase domain-containing protein [Saprospiraceae bacterium]|nr:sulfotransferase domain-containing protein [Lewinellaceae bacterium]HRX28411.1 sulfotransferase domain-containing protein [Saprospiraceae bacterium]
MVWLVSFPRSGNTFLRNILADVFNVPSSEYHLNRNRSIAENWDSFPVVKTHLTPDLLSPLKDEDKVIYLIRDGRDACVSLAHHRVDIKKRSKSFLMALVSVVLGVGNQFKGGWSGHVNAWKDRADIAIRFEDLIVNPGKEMDKLKLLLNLGEAIGDFPTIQSQRVSSSYAVNRKEPQNLTLGDREKFFRKGKMGSYREEMPFWVKILFQFKHGKTLKNFGYK